MLAVSLMYGVHHVLQRCHREHCSRNLFNAIMFSNSEACAYLDSALGFLETFGAYLVRTALASGGVLASRLLWASFSFPVATATLSANVLNDRDKQRRHHCHRRRALPARGAR